MLIGSRGLGVGSVYAAVKEMSKWVTGRGTTSGNPWGPEILEELFFNSLESFGDMVDISLYVLMDYLGGYVHLLHTSIAQTIGASYLATLICCINGRAAFLFCCFGYASNPARRLFASPASLPFLTQDPAIASPLSHFSIAGLVPRQPFPRILLPPPAHASVFSPFTFHVSLPVLLITPTSPNQVTPIPRSKGKPQSPEVESRNLCKPMFLFSVRFAFVVLLAEMKGRGMSECEWG